MLAHRKARMQFCGAVGLIVAGIVGLKLITSSSA
jgi:hypothetical protein